MSLAVKTSHVERLASSGYFASLSCTVVFAAALLSSYPNGLLEAGGTRGIIDAIYIATAAVMTGLSAMFEVAQRLQNRISIPLSVSFVSGLTVAGAALFVLPQLRPLPAVVVLLLGTRAIFVLRQFKWQDVLFPLLGGAMLGYWAFFLSFVDGYKNPWVDDAVLLGRVHVDLLFHSGIVNMLLYYGVGSLGVDGIQPFPYHFGSHRIVAALSSLFKIQPLSFYSVIFPLIFSPFFIAALLYLTVAFRGFLQRNSTVKKNIGLTEGKWFWVTLVILFIGVIPAFTQRQLGLFYNAFHSESFSAAMLFAYIPCMLFFEGIAGRAPRRLNFAWLVLSALYLLELCTLKISVAFVFAGVAGYLLLRLRMSWSGRIYGFVALTAPLTYGLWLTRADSDSESGLSLMQMLKPFAFIRDLIPANLRFESFCAFFGPPIAFLLLRITLCRPSLWHEFRLSRLGNYDSIDIEAFVILLFISVTPSLVVSVPQGATNFFSEISYWLTIPMLSVVLSTHLQNHRIGGHICGWLKTSRERN